MKILVLCNKLFMIFNISKHINLDQIVYYKKKCQYFINERCINKINCRIKIIKS